MRSIQEERRRVLGLEIVEFPKVMRRFFKKLLRSNALDALDAAVVNEPITVEAAQPFVTQISATPSFAEHALGHEKDVRLNGPEASGAALSARGRYRHVCAFAKDQKALTLSDIPALFRQRIFSRPSLLRHAAFPKSRSSTQRDAKGFAHTVTGSAPR